MSAASKAVPSVPESTQQGGQRASARGRTLRGGWWLLLLPAIILILLVFAFPVALILSRAFTEPSSADGGALSNLAWFFGDETQRTILLRTFVTSAIVTITCLVVCYPFAYALTLVRGPWLMLLLGCTILALWQSTLVRNFAWRIILRREGVVNQALEAVGLPNVQLLGTTAGVIIGMAHVMAPFMILPLYASMRTIDRRLLTAARSLGASPASAFFRIYVPLSAPGIAAGAVLVSIVSLGFYITPAMLGSSTNSLLSQAIQQQVNRTLNWGHAGAQSLVLLGVTLLLLGASYALLRGRLAVLANRGRSD